MATILGSPKTCRSTKVIDSLWVGIDLGISVRMLVISSTHFLFFSLIFGGFIYPKKVSDHIAHGW